MSLLAERNQLSLSAHQAADP